MATTGIGTPGTLSSALAPKKSKLVPVLLLIAGLVVALGAAAYGYIESQRTEKVVIVARPIAYGQQIVAEDLATIELPLHRPVQMAGLTDPSVVIGKWAARDLGQNDLLNTTMLLPVAPDHPVYPNGRELHKNMVPVPFATSTIGPLTDRDLVNLGFTSTDPRLCNQVGGTVMQTPAGLLVSMTTVPAAPIQSGQLQAAQQAPAPAVDPNAPQAGQQLRAFACRFLERVPVLYIDNGTAYLEVTPYQAHAVWALQASGSQLWGERYGQSSDPLVPMDKLDAAAVTLDRLTAPISDTTTINTLAMNSGSALPASTAATAIPGGGVIPGSGGSIPGTQPTAVPEPTAVPQPTAKP